jgi:hypothetical protein
MPMDCNWTPQMCNKIISGDSATCSITPPPLRLRPVNPGLRCLFCLHWAIFIVNCTPEFIEITFRPFVRPFPGDSRNTAITLIVTTNVCAIQVVPGLTVSPLIDQSGLRQNGRSATIIFPILLETFRSESRVIYQEYLFRHRTI